MGLRPFVYTRKELYSKGCLKFLQRKYLQPADFIHYSCRFLTTCCVKNNQSTMYHIYFIQKKKKNQHQWHTRVAFTTEFLSFVLTTSEYWRVPPNTRHSWYLLHLVCWVCFFVTGSAVVQATLKLWHLYSRLPWYTLTLCSQDWSETPDPSAYSFWMLGIPVCAIMPATSFIVIQLIYLSGAGRKIYTKYVLIFILHTSRKAPNFFSWYFLKDMEMYKILKLFSNI